MQFSQGTSTPYVYVETISKSAKVDPVSYLEDNGSMTLDKWKVEQSKDPTLHFIIQKEFCCKGKLSEIRPYLKSLKQFQLHDGLLYRKVFSDKHGNSSISYSKSYPLNSLTMF